MENALADKARECNMAIDKICLAHREEIRSLHEKYEAELAAAESKVAREIFAEFELHIRKAVEGWQKQLMFESEKDHMDMIMARLDAFGYCIYVLNNLEKKYTEGVTDGNNTDKTI